MRRLCLLAVVVVGGAGCDINGSDDAASHSESHSVTSPYDENTGGAAARGWSQLPTPPVAARDAVVVSGGGQLLYWGGRIGSGSDQAAGIYRVATRSWRHVASAPIAPRGRPAAVWTGKDFLIWGGGADRGARDGAAYDPEIDEWRLLPRAPLPARVPAVSVWTGNEMLVWGDAGRSSRARDGAAYDPRADRWRTLPVAPLALNQANAVWTGEEMIVFGARLDGGNRSETNNARGIAYSPRTDSWRLIPVYPLVPQASSIAWTAAGMLAWDYVLLAALYDRATNSWSAVNRLPLAPAECYPESVTVGKSVFAWYCGQAAVYHSADGRWEAIDPPAGVEGGTPVASGRDTVTIGPTGTDARFWEYRIGHRAAKAPTQPGLAGTLAGQPAKLIELAETKRKHCRRSRLLRGACPRLAPSVNAPYLSHLAKEARATPQRFDIFDLEWGGEYPGAPRRNRPPRMAHVVLVAGRIGGISPSGDPVCRSAVPLTDGLMRRPRERPLCFGGARIGGRDGDLFLVPPFPTGGMIGNHLVFRWEQDGEHYALSLHAWEPLTETAATLAAIVAAAGPD